MISKELLSEILKEYKFPFSYEYNTYNDYTKKIYFYVNSELKIDFFSINIYELAHKCKEWAISKGWVLHEVRNLKEYIIYFSGDFRESSNDFRADTEHEAIFQACEWILKESK